MNDSKSSESVSAGQLPSAKSSGDTRRLRVPKKLRSLLVAFLVAFCLVQIGTALNSVDSSDPAKPPAAIENLDPVRGAQTVPGQSTITADLKFGYQGVLIVNGLEIPDDQVNYTRATGTLTFTPGKEKEYELLPGGEVRVVVIYWPEQGSRATDSQQYAWSFNVL